MLSIILGAFFMFVGTNGAIPGMSQNIVGGDEIDIERYPFMVSILYSDRHICGGSILNEYYIVTAAHCVLEKDPSDISVRTGSTFRNHGGVMHEVYATFYHPEYTRKIKTHDIGIIQLATPITFNEHQQPVQIFDTSLRFDGGEEVVAIGWGRTSHGGKASNKLEKVAINLLDKETCVKSFTRKITFTMICAAAPNRDGCQGDSGGPLLKDGKLIGVSSWGIGCANPKYPGVYTDITTERNFISNITGL